MDDYKIRKSVKIKGVSVGVYFKDNTTSPLFNLSDLTRLVSPDVYLTTKALVVIADEKNCVKLQTNMSYKIWACNFEGLCNLLRNTIHDEADDIINSVKEFVENQRRTLPGPLEVKTEMRQIFSKKYFSLIFTDDGIPVRYVKIGNNRFFAVQDVIRSFKLKPSDVEEMFEAVDNAYKCNVTFRNSETRLCVSEEGVKVLLKNVLPDIEESYVTALDNNCVSLESEIPDNKDPDIIIDGDKTDQSRYLISDLKDNQTVTVRYNKNTFLSFFSVTKTAQHLGISTEKSLAAAREKKLAFVTAEDIFVDIDSLTDIFKDIKESFAYCAELFDLAVSSDIRFEAYKQTDISHELTLIGSEKQKEISKTVKQFKPTRISGNRYVIAYDNVTVGDKHVLMCLVKKDLSNSEEKVSPLFWTTSVGLYADCSRFSRTAKEMFDHECCKVTLADIKKFNIKMITFSGAKQVLGALKTVKETEKISEELKEAAIKFAEEQGYIVDFEEYEQKEIGTVQEEAKITEENKEESVKEERSNLEYGQIIFMGKQLDIAVAITQDKGAVIYYNVSQLCDILGVDENKLPPFNRQKDNNGTESLISIYDIPDTLSGLVDNANDITRNLFETSKPAVAQIADRLGLKVKDNSKEQDDLMTKLLNSSDSRSYTIGAVILAEKFREQLMLFKIKDIKTDLVEGPANGQLLEDLWKFIDCQEPDQKISFGFTKQVVLVSERYNRLKNTFKI